MKMLSVLLLPLLIVSSFSEQLRFDSRTESGNRRLEAVDAPITMCGTFTCCYQVQGYSFETITKHNGKDGKVPESYSIDSKLYASTDCSGDVIVDEQATFKWVDYQTVMEYPYKVIGKRTVTSYSIVFNEWNYFGVPVTCTGMTLGQSYSLNDVHCVNQDGNSPVSAFESASTTECTYTWKDNDVIDCDEMKITRSSNSGCSNSTALIIWIVVIVVIVIIIVIVVIVMMQNKKKRLEKEKEKKEKQERKEKEATKVIEMTASEPAQPAAGEMAPTESTVESVPTQPAPVESATTQPTVVESTPSESPVEAAPAEPAAVDSTPVQPAPAEPAPAEPTPVQPAPVDSTPSNSDPLQSTELTPTETTPAQSTPVEPAPVETKPIESTENVPCDTPTEVSTPPNANL